MIQFAPSSDCKTVITWQGEHCEAVVDIGTVDATSAIQLGLLLRKMGGYLNIHLEFNEYRCAIVKWTRELYNTRDVLLHEHLVDAAINRMYAMNLDIADYNHHCAIMETAEESKAA